jgi:tetratricopeptide (TPR) repeat protein
MAAHAYVNPSASKATGIMDAVNLNNEAIQLEQMGSFEEAEKKYLESLALKKRATGENSTGVALTKNALGELYMKMGRLDEAQALLEHAEQIRSGELCSGDKEG